MKNANISLNPAALVASLRAIRPYIGVLIFLFFAGVYGFVIFQINALSSPPVDQSEVLAQAKAVPTPRIDSNAAAQLLSLKDNSENVHTLFEQGRTNPFQE